MLSSSIQATLAGRFGNSEYGRSKKAGEELFFQYAQETGAKVAVYRFVNLMGHSRPKYNSAVSTFCWAVANDEPFTVNDRSTELELLYIDDLVEGMFDLLEGKEQHCEFDGVETVLQADGRYCCVPVTHKVTLGKIVDLLQEFKTQPTTLMMPKMPDGSFAKKLYSLYLTYLPTDKFKYALKMNVDNRGSFTELVHTTDCGQVSINISKPGITKGQHWHNSKWELFIVVAGHGLIQERNINTGETVEFEVSGDKIEAVHMIPGWTHNIINLSETENLVTVMTCNEILTRTIRTPSSSRCKTSYWLTLGEFYGTQFYMENDGRTKVMIGCGTRPEIIRLAAVIKRCREYFDCCVVYYNQNWDRNLSTVFWEDFELKTPSGNMARIFWFRWLARIWA